MADIFKNNDELYILDLQTNETIIQSLMDSRKSNLKITKLSNYTKLTFEDHFAKEEPMEDLYYEMKKIINKEVFDIAIFSNLDKTHNIYTNASMIASCSKFICFNEYNYGTIKLENILEYLGKGLIEMVLSYAENPNQNIHLAKVNKWN